MAAILSLPQCVYSLCPSNAKWHCRTLLSLVQVMSCPLLSTKPLLEAILYYIIVNWPCGSKVHRNLNQTLIFIQGNPFEITVCKMAAILSQRQSANLSLYHSLHITDCDRIAVSLSCMTQQSSHIDLLLKKLDCYGNICSITDVSSQLPRDHFVYASSQWETTLQCNVVSHWLGAFTKWSLNSHHI